MGVGTLEFHDAFHDFTHCGRVADAELKTYIFRPGDRGDEP